MISIDMTYTPENSSSESSNSNDSIEGSIYSSHKNKRKRSFNNNSHGEFRKAKPPTFDGEVKSSQEYETWLLWMRKYFQVQDYSVNKRKE